MKAKIIEIYGHEFGGSECYHDTLYTLQQTTDWDEITEEELKMLVKWAQNKNNTCYGGARTIIVTDRNVRIPPVLKECIKRAELEVKDKEAKELAKQEKEAKRKKTLEANMLAKKKKLLKQLQSELGTNNV